MRRALTALFATALLSVAVAVPATAGQGTDGYVCDHGDMHTLATVDYDLLWETPSALNCDFRLFIEPDAPLVWTENESFFGGDYWWLTAEEREAMGWSGSDVVKYLNQLDEHLFWGPASTPDASLNELKVQQGPMFVEENGTIRRQTYFSFGPQKPGLYKWRYTYDDHMWFMEVARGEICIVPAQAQQQTPPCSDTGA